jgi:hypothetical protein
MKKRGSLIFVDLVEDKIKSRGIFITVSLLFYVYLTWRFIIGDYSRDNTPTRIDNSLEFSRFTYLGQDISESLSPQVKISNSNGEPLEGINVTISVVKITTERDKKTVPV